MDGKINWNGFEYLEECGLTESKRAGLKRAANIAECDLFMQCKRRIEEECPIDVQKECFGKVLDYKANNSPKSK
jgi:hypothetical protein